MFKRIFVEDWAQIIPMISFFIFVSVFVLVTIRAMRLRKTERERLAAMPLDSPDTPSPTNLP